MLRCDTLPGFQFVLSRTRRTAMRRLAILLLISANGLAAAAQIGAAPLSPATGMRDRLIGAWRLVSLQVAGADGKMTQQKRVGILIYTKDGHVSAQLMSPTSSSPEVSGPVKYEENGYEAYFGGYDIDEKTQTVTHHVEGALVRSLIGKDLGRVYRFSGDRLILKSSRPDERWTIEWEHY